MAWSPAASSAPSGTIPTISLPLTPTPRSSAIRLEASNTTWGGVDRQSIRLQETWAMPCGSRTHPMAWRWGNLASGSQAGTRGAEGGGDGRGNPSVRPIEVDVVGDQQGAGTNGDGTAPTVKCRRAEVGPVVAVGKSLVPAPPYRGERDTPLGGRGAVEVDGDPDVVPDPSVRPGGPGRHTSSSTRRSRARRGARPPLRSWDGLLGVWTCRSRRLRCEPG